MLTARQAQILETATELITKKGIQGSTIKDLLKAIDISELAVYRHFDGKTSFRLFT